MVWEVTLQESVVKDLRWFGRKVGRLLLAEAETLLSVDPLAETRNLKTLRPNAVAQRELRLQGKYRLLFNVDEEAQTVTIILVGEKQGNKLIVQGEGLPHTMKVIPLSEAKARLSHYGRLCHKEPIIVTVNGVPVFQLVPLDEEDDLIDQLLEHNPAFEELLKARLRERNLSSKEAARRL